MILRAAYVLFVVVSGTESLPFSNFDIRPAHPMQQDQNFHRPDSAGYSAFQFPDRRSPGMFSSGLLVSLNHPPDSHFSGILDRIRHHAASSKPSTSIGPSRVSLNKYLDDINQQTAQKIHEIEQRVKHTVKQPKENRGQGMQGVKEMLQHKFGPENTMERLKQVFIKKEAVVNGLTRGQHKFFGIPYHTMNDDHKVVKKPEADLGLVLHDGVSILAPVPTIQSIGGQHPVIPEVTTSVVEHEESETPATVSGYMFPITATTFVPEVARTTQLTNSITDSDVTKSTKTSNDSGTSSQISRRNTTEKAFASIEFIAEVGTASSPIRLLSNVVDENDGGATSEREIITDINSNLYSTPFTDTTSDWETTRVEANSTTTLTNNLEFIVDDLEVIQSFPSITTIADNEFTDSIGNVETMAGGIPSTVSANLSVLEIVPSAGASAESAYDSISSSADMTGTTSERGPTFSYTILIDKITTPAEISTISADATETPASELDTLLHELTSHHYDPVLDAEKTTEIVPELASMTINEISATNLPIGDSMIDNESDSIFPASSSTKPDKILPDSENDDTAIDVTITVETETTLYSTYSSSNSTTIREQISTMLPTRITEVTQFPDDTFIFNDDYRVNVTNPAGLPTEVDPSFPYTISTKRAEELSALDQVFTEIDSSLPSTISYENTRPGKEISDIHSFSDNSLFVETSTEENVLPTTPIVAIEMTSKSLEAYDNAEIILTHGPVGPTEAATTAEEIYATTDSPTKHSTTGEETITESVSIFYTLIEPTTTVPGIRSTFGSRTEASPNEMQMIMETNSPLLPSTSEAAETLETTTPALVDELSIFKDDDSLRFTTVAETPETVPDGIKAEPTFLYAVSTERVTPITQASTSYHPVAANSESDIESTKDVVSTLPSTVSDETPPSSMEMSTVGSFSDDSIIYEETTTENVPTHFSEIPRGIISIDLRFLTSTERSSYSKIYLQRSTEIGPTSQSTFSVDQTTTTNSMGTSAVDAVSQQPIIDDEITTKVDSKHFSIDQIEFTTTAPERSTTIVDPAIRTDANAETDPITLSFSILAETTTSAGEIFTTSSSSFDSLEVGATVSDAAANETTEISEIVDEASGSMVINYTSTTNETGPTTERISVLSPIFPTEAGLIFAEGLATADQFFVDSTVATEGTMVMDGPRMMSSTIRNEPHVSRVSISIVDSSYDSPTYADPAFANLTISSQTTTRIMPTLLSTISNQTPSGSAQTSATGLALDDLVIDEEKTTDVVWRFSTTSPTDTTTTMAEKSTTPEPITDDSKIDRGVTAASKSALISTTSTDIPTGLTSLDETYPTIDKEEMLEITSTSSSVILNETNSSSDEIYTTNFHFGSSTIDETTIAEGSPTFEYKIPIEEITTISQKLTAYDKIMDEVNDYYSRLTLPTQMYTTADLYFDGATIRTDETEKVIGTLLPDESSTSVNLESDSLTTEAKPTVKIDSILASVGLSAESTTDFEHFFSDSAEEIAEVQTDLPHDSSTFDEEIIMESVSTLSSESTTETTTILPERLTFDELFVSGLTIETNVSAEIRVMASTEVATSSERTVTLTTDEITPILYSSSTIESPETSATYTVLGTPTRSENNLISSIGVETTKDYSIISTKRTTVVPEWSRTGDPKLDSSTIYKDSSAEIVSILPPTISTDTYNINFGGTFASTESPIDSSAIVEVSTAKVMPISSSTVLPGILFHYEEKTTTDLAYVDSTDYGETNEGIVSDVPTAAYDTETMHNTPDHGGNSDKIHWRTGRLLKEDSHSVTSSSDWSVMKKMDDRTLLNSISMVIRRLRENETTAEEERKLSEVFGDIWPLMVEKSKQKSWEPVDRELAILLQEARRRVSDGRRVSEVLDTDDFDSAESLTRVNVSPFSNNIGQEYSFEEIETHPEMSSVGSSLSKKWAQSVEPAPVRIVKIDNNSENYNSEYYQIHDEDSDRSSIRNYNNKVGSIKKFLHFALHQETKERDFPQVELSV